MNPGQFKVEVTSQKVEISEMSKVIFASFTGLTALSTRVT